MRALWTRVALGLVTVGVALATGAGATDVGIPGVKTIISVNNVSGTAKLTSIQKGSGVAIGGGTDASVLNGTLDIYYVDDPQNAGSLSMPAPWKKKTAKIAKFKNTQAPAGPSSVKVTTIKVGKLTKVVAKGLGGLDIATPPGAGGVVTILSLANGNDASSFRFCSRYSAADGSELSHRLTGSGFRLKLKGGVPIACPNCSDGMQAGDETGIDCGGGTCGPCPDGQGCNGAADCQSGVCTGNICQAPTCLDGIENGSETGIDCGGACPGCADGEDCTTDGDCQSGVCLGNVCQVPTCLDGVQNGSETGVDCGGPCGGCPDGGGCTTGSDCQSQICIGNVCQVPSCTDGAQNGAETGSDCGGPCAGCPNGGGCATGSDCQSQICIGNVCQVPNCMDGAQNGAETGSDCGGPCAGCPNGGGCATGSDCQSQICIGNVCQVPNCMDGAQNGAETGSDCGGPCPGCPNGGGCATGSDCQSQICIGNVCQVPNCMDGAENGSETGPDCGGPCPGCAPGLGCMANSDCQSDVCVGNVCQAPTCTDVVQNGNETGIDCGGPCPQCGNGSGCLSNNDCQSGVCTGNICQAPTCVDGVHNGSESGPDCGGSCPGCAPGQACNTGGDCLSGVCIGNVCQVPTCTDGVQNGGEIGVDCGGPCTACSCVTRGQCLMFVTTASSGGNLGSLAGADSTCNAHASAAGLVGVYQAWLCVNGVAPATRSLHASVAYRRTDGALIANNWADLTDGSIVSAINRTEFGVNVSATAPFLPWTFVTTAGTCDNETYLSPGSGPCPIFASCPTNCANNSGSNAWTSSSGFAQGSKGDINATNGNWTDGTTGLCSTPAERIYCIEQ